MVPHFKMLDSTHDILILEYGERVADRGRKERDAKGRGLAVLTVPKDEGASLTLAYRTLREADVLWLMSEGLTEEVATSIRFAVETYDPAFAVPLLILDRQEGAVPRSFTVIEFARLLETLPGVDVSEWEPGQV